MAGCLICGYFDFQTYWQWFYAILPRSELGRASLWAQTWLNFAMYSQVKQNTKHFCAQTSFKDNLERIEMAHSIQVVHSPELYIISSKRSYVVQPDRMEKYWFHCSHSASLNHPKSFAVLCSFCQVRYVDDVLRADDDSAYLAFIVDRLGSQHFRSDMLRCYCDVALERAGFDPV